MKDPSWYREDMTLVCGAKGAVGSSSGAGGDRATLTGFPLDLGRHRAAFAAVRNGNRRRG